MFDNIRADYALHRPLRNRALWALAVYRFGRWSMQQTFPPWRWLTSKIYGVLNILSEIVTGVIMDRNVQLGKGFHIIHPERVRIHADAVIGDRVGVMHGVTIGTGMYPGVPVIGNDVFIGANATIIGKIRIGDGARIAANSLVISNVPPGATAIGVPAKIMRVPATRHPGRRSENRD
ncbi:MAG: serine O-acetyltransferase [Steroidobacteraceae bacterium]